MLSEWGERRRVHERRQWDAIVVGTGMGGATLGFSLARAGLSVLFLEKGNSHLAPRPLRGDYAECFFPRAEAPRPLHAPILARAGRCAELLLDRSRRRAQSFIPFIGCGTGGSSALYGMALERLFPADFTPRARHPGVDETSLPEAWPISYEDLRPHYEAAERLFAVRGTRDPLRPDAPRALGTPPPLHPANQAIEHVLHGRGLHPYRLPMACEYATGDDRCQGFLDDGERKNDSARMCLVPALRDHGAQLLDACEVVGLETTGSQVTGVRARRGARPLMLRARQVILAAGALATPRILMDSASRHWPRGLANRSGLVGVNLMRHFIDLYIVHPGCDGTAVGNIKQLAFNDLYDGDAGKLGTVQSFGEWPPAAMCLTDLEQDLKEGPGALALPFVRLARPLLRRHLENLRSRSVLLASIVEDLPHPENRVSVLRSGADGGTGRLTLEYRIRKREARRIARSREILMATFKAFSVKIIKQAENNQRIAHACGTCRFGNDPRTSVLDADNRAHGIDNLYIIDASFFPSSGGTNPALTIAANALRVAARLRDRMGARSQEAVRARMGVDR